MILHDPDDALLMVTLPMPPSDNNLVRLARLGAYPTNDYREWLRICAPMLDDALTHARARNVSWADHAMLVDIGRTPWYSVNIGLQMPSGRRDGQNYEKALFDLLSGKRLENPANRTSRLVMGSGVWPDDSLVAKHTTEVLSRGGDDHCVQVAVFLEQPPRPLDAIAKLRPKCLRRYERMERGDAPACLRCGLPVNAASWRDTIYIIPGPGRTTAVLCGNCMPDDEDNATSILGPRAMVQSRPDLHWEYIHVTTAHGLALRTHDLIWT